MNDINTILPHVRLKFNIDHPNYEECYMLGYESAQTNLSEADNPYKEGSVEAEQWLEGWWAGIYDEKPLFSLNQVVENQDLEGAANDESYQTDSGFFAKVLRITGTIAATAVVGYQVLDLVA